jgi:hypothetical protein
MLYPNALPVALSCGLQWKLSHLHTLLAAPSQTPRNAQERHNVPRVTADIQGGEQFGRSVLCNYFNQIWRQWHAEPTYRGVRCHFPSVEMSAKRIFQLASPTEKLADCSVGTLKYRGLTRACCIYYWINDASTIRWLTTVMRDCWTSSTARLLQKLLNAVTNVTASVV